MDERDFKSLIDEKYEGSTEHKAALERDRKRLMLGEPLAYVIGWIPFLGLKIHLDSHPLIPRPETEWWVEELARATSKRSGPQGEAETGDPRTFARSARQFRILDLCAGSGAIGCALLKLVPDARVSFGEIVPEHAETIRKNILENGLERSRADIRIGDLFAPFAGERFDMIAANPPYIPAARPLPKSVALFEPEVALRAGNDGLEIIRRIANETRAYMKPGGELWLECDAEHASAARDLVARGAKRAELRTDQYGRPRLIVGYY